MRAWICVALLLSTSCAARGSLGRPDPPRGDRNLTPAITGVGLLQRHGGDCEISVRTDAGEAWADLPPEFCAMTAGGAAALEAQRVEEP